jgi:hypothetical protein
VFTIPQQTLWCATYSAQERRPAAKPAGVGARGPEILMSLRSVRIRQHDAGAVMSALERERDRCRQGRSGRPAPGGARPERRGFGMSANSRQQEHLRRRPETSCEATAIGHFVSGIGWNTFGDVAPSVLLAYRPAVVANIAAIRA